MAKNLRKYMSILLISVMLFSLASCKGAGDVVDDDTDVSANVADSDISAEPEHVDDPLYANAALAREGAYDVTLIESPHVNEKGYYVKSGNAGDGAYFIYSVNDEYENSAFYVELYDNKGSLKDSFNLSLPLVTCFYGDETATALSDDVKGIRYENPLDLLDEYDIDCEAVTDLYYSNFYLNSDGEYEAILTLWTGDEFGGSENIYFDVRWDKDGGCTDVVYIPLELNGGYVSNFSYLDDDSLLALYVSYGSDGYTESAVIYGPDRFYDIKSSVAAENDELGEWTSNTGSTVIVNGKPLILYWDYSEEGTVYASEIDTEKIDIIDKNEVKLLGGGSNFVLGVTDDGGLVFSHGSGLQLWKPGEKGTLFLDFINSDMRSNGCGSFVDIDGLDAFYVAAYTTDDRQCLAFCEARDPESIPDNKVITLGVNRLYADLTNRIVDFNTADNGCRICVRDYSVYETYANYNAGIEKMYEDMANGRMTDIVSIDYMADIDLRSLADKGVIADIGELIDNDPSMSYDDYCKNVFGAFSIGGKLYQVIPSFVIDTWYGSEVYLDGKEVFNLDEFLDYAQSVTDAGDMTYGIYMTRQEFMQDVISNMGYYWVDMDQLTCDFNDPSFYKLLGYSLTLPEYLEYNGPVADAYWDDYDNNMRTGFLRFETTTISDLRNDVYAAYATCDEYPVFVGLPTPCANGSCLGYNEYFMLSETSLLKDEAWDFVKTFLTDYQFEKGHFGLPVLKDALDAEISLLGEPYFYYDEDGNMVKSPYTYLVNGEEKEVPQMDAAHISRYEDFVYSVNRMYFNERELKGVIMNELNDAAAEGRTPEETASNLQIIVQDYLDSMR